MALIVALIGEGAFLPFLSIKKYKNNWTICLIFLLLIQLAQCTVLPSLHGDRRDLKYLDARQTYGGL